MNEVVNIVNFKQVALYLKHNVKPIDIKLGYKDKIIFIFNKEDTKEVFDKWVKHELI